MMGSSARGDRSGVWPLWNVPKERCPWRRDKSTGQRGGCGGRGSSGGQSGTGGHWASAGMLGTTPGGPTSLPNAVSLPARLPAPSSHGGGDASSPQPGAPHVLAPLQTGNKNRLLPPRSMYWVAAGCSGRQQTTVGGGFGNTRGCFPQSYRSGCGQAGSVEAPLLGPRTAVSSLCPHTIVPLCTSVS